MLEIAYRMPRDSAHVLAACNPVPPLVRLQAHVILDIVSSATPVDAGDAAMVSQRPATIVATTGGAVSTHGGLNTGSMFEDGEDL